MGTTSTPYYYVKNLQGDIVAIARGGDGAILARYTYDAWGNILSVTDNSGHDISNKPNEIANINPLRYRGYYYDSETGLYYLKSRFYDPTTGRFVNADSVVTTSSLLGTNLYTYCFNNPIRYTDSSGNLPTPDQWLGLGRNSKLGLQMNGNVYNNLKDQSNITFKANSLPTTGEPGSNQTLPNPDGSIKQKRWYGPDGNAERDRDYNHSGDLPFPHDHEWNDGVRGKDHVPPSLEYEFNSDPLVGAGIVVVCVIGIGIVLADDVTGVGVANDFLLGPLGAGVGEGVILIFG